MRIIIKKPLPAKTLLSLDINQTSFALKIDPITSVGVQIYTTPP
jgi:hypothetical protein